MKKSQRFREILLLAMSILLIITCHHQPSEPDEPDTPDTSQYHYSEPVETGDGWETGTLSSVGMDSSLFEDLVQAIDNGVCTEVHAILVVRNNKLVFEKYWAGHDFGMSSPDYHGAMVEFDWNTRHNTHSATKSITSILVGIAIDEELILNENAFVFQYLPPLYDAWNNEGREGITIKHCLTMSSGLEWNEWDTGVTSADADLMRFNDSYNPIAYLLSKPIVTPPGTSFYYNGGTVDLLGVLIANAAGQSVQRFSADHLFGPLGITNYNWVTLWPSGITACHGDIHITPRDMAKIGQLFLDEGEWNGEPVLSKTWVEQSNQYHVDPGVSWADGYGYLWWLRNFDINGRIFRSFKAIGWGGQEIFVFKELNMVVVFTGANYVTEVPCDEIMRQVILPAIEE
jgi:CubicO group peptidase (beta-lactamase class C family)